MPTDTERKKILEMIADGTITAEDGVKLLDALDDSEYIEKSIAVGLLEPVNQQSIY